MLAITVMDIKVYCLNVVHVIIVQFICECSYEKLIGSEYRGPCMNTTQKDEVLPCWVSVFTFVKSMTATSLPVSQESSHAWPIVSFQNKHAWDTHVSVTWQAAGFCLRWHLD